ncbi:MAG: hypothetical protein GEU88_11340 [Solirubrobacterales bacterium]|nr:hypothetical protein [Solirubrobacterales bacterium]
MSKTTIRTLAIVLAAAVALVAATAVQADRKPTDKQARAIAKVMDLPAKCARIRVSTRTPRPKWAALTWRPGPGCEPFAADGVAVVKKKRRAGRPARWRFVTAGSAFECPGLYRDVPRRVARDLGIDCH